MPAVRVYPTGKKTKPKILNPKPMPAVRAYPSKKSKSKETYCRGKKALVERRKRPSLEANEIHTCARCTNVSSWEEEMVSYMAPYKLPDVGGVYSP